ncbi:RES family NAD+ phosphorylase [Pleomorphovibrio marinus]|uniref:RES family NAD+ phosphorylase n=1 Tax=Pleomorphovibrio marinus TaxID=2164132 RepID=UPI000E0B80BA|nr:RES family NAD+ phosphorylase [Pleomorphovibrio marinus]
MNHRNIIDELKKVDFSTDKRDFIYERLKRLGKFGIIIATLHKGKRIIRARLSEKESFKNVSQLSFKPQEFNHSYQRASTPKHTMFYGSMVPEFAGKTEPETARITILFELSEFVRSTETVGEEGITFSSWEVSEDIELLSLVHHKNFERSTELSKKLQADFEDFAEKHPDLNVATLEISEYLGHEFAKTEIPNHLHYMISALYSEIICSNFDGILYPSVRLAGEGINVAVKPESVNNKLNFLGASECTVYKNKKSVFVGNDNQSTLNGNGDLQFFQIEDNHFTPKDIGRKQVGLL